jgi:hypothetical protein
MKIIHYFFKKNFEGLKFLPTISTCFLGFIVLKNREFATEYSLPKFWFWAKWLKITT